MIMAGVFLFLLITTTGAIAQSGAKFDLDLNKHQYLWELSEEKIKQMAPFNQEQACKDYAAVAIQAYQEDQSRNCGFYPGAGWGGDYQAHYVWCMTGSNATKIPSKIKHLRDSLEQCRACENYSNTAVSQNKTNQLHHCGYGGGQWNSNYNHHFKWCMQGQSITTLQKQTNLRQGKLGFCQPVYGNFKIKSIKPVVDLPGTGLVKTIAIEMEVNSQKPWKIGRYGPGDKGSLWLDLKVINKTEWGSKVIQRRFSITGQYDGAYVPTFVSPVVGTGKKNFTIKVAPSYPSNIRLEAFKMLYHHPGGLISNKGIAQPGSFDCSFNYPDIEATVYMVTRDGVKSATRKKTQIKYDGIFFNTKTKKIGPWDEVPLRGSGPCP